MEDAFFTVEEAGRILDCKRSWVYELLAEGWLNRPAGGTKRETGGRVTKKSLYQFILVDRLSRLPNRALKAIKSSQKYVVKSESTNSNANRFFIDEGRSEVAEAADPSPYPLPQGEGENNNQRKQCLHHDFAEKHQFSFGMRAWQLAPDDPATQDDLIQEMSLAVLEYDKPASFDLLFELAGNRAIDYLKYEAARGKMSLIQARHVSDKRAEQRASLETFIHKLLQDGVPAEWIEEVIDWRLDAA